MAASAPLTKKIIEAAEPQAKRYNLWDSEVPGFGVRVNPQGTKVFRVRYRPDGGGRAAPVRDVTIGRWGILTVEEARKQAKRILAEVTMGGDPGAERGEKRKTLKIAELIDLYEAEGCYIQRGKRQGQPMKDTTRQYTLARLRHHVVPLLGSKRLTDVGATEMERFFRDVEAGKTASDTIVGPRRRIVVRGGNGAARKVFRDLSAVFSFAVRRELMASNPCEKAVVDKTDKQRTRFLTLAELSRLGAACDALEKEGMNPKALNITRLWALTGCRRQEITALKWSEVDFERGLLVLADTKTGRSIRPLADPALMLLRGIKRQEGSDYVFPADSGGDSFFQGTKTVWPRIVKRAGLEGITPHTLRHTMGATATSTGEPLAFTGAILGHANMRSTMIYAHVDLDPSRHAANRVAAKIADVLLAHGEVSR